MSAGAIGSTVEVPYLNESGLTRVSSVRFLIREQHVDLWDRMSDSSCLVEGPPGSGKSTATWYWLLNRVRTTGSTALWFHFNKLGAHFATIVRLINANLSFEVVEDDDKFRARNYLALHTQTCVVDGVTKDNLKEAGESWKMFGGNALLYAECHMIWVSSQSLAVPLEHLQTLNMTRFLFFSWSEDEIHQFAKSFHDGKKNAFIQEVVSATPPSRLATAAIVDFDLALEIKMYYCGCSARWMFGMRMEEAIDDIETYLEKVQDSRSLLYGLSGSRAVAAVNHLIAMYQSNDPEKKGDFRIASKFIMERLSHMVGLEVIRAMYTSGWVQGNPSVHGFVFEWDIITRLNKFKSLTVVDSLGTEIVWQITRTQRLAEFLRGGAPQHNVLVCPEKWNHPEYDGLYIFLENGVLHLIAWNASEATTHTGSVRSLLVMLESLSRRDRNQINFATLRFVFLVPRVQMDEFRLPNDSASLLARQQLAAWGFMGFEVCGTERSEPD